MGFCVAAKGIPAGSMLDCPDERFWYCRGTVVEEEG